jgi:hypothetical protein
MHLRKAIHLHIYTIRRHELFPNETILYKVIMNHTLGKNEKIRKDGQKSRTKCVFTPVVHEVWCAYSLILEFIYLDFEEICNMTIFLLFKTDCENYDI